MVSVGIGVRETKDIYGTTLTSSDSYGSGLMDQCMHVEMCVFLKFP